MFQKYFKKHLFEYLFPGDYYSIYHATNIINRSANNEKTKRTLIQFLIDASRRGLSPLTDVNPETKHKFYSIDKFKKLIKLLIELKINPILIPKNTKGTSTLRNPFSLFDN